MDSLTILKVKNGYVVDEDGKAGKNHTSVFESLDSLFSWMEMHFSISIIDKEKAKKSKPPPVLSEYEIGETVLLKTKEELIKEYPDKWDEEHKEFNCDPLDAILPDMFSLLETTVCIDVIREDCFKANNWSWPFEVIKEKVNK